MWQWLICLQSFVIGVLAMVIATFSTGIDSKCFQVWSTVWKTYSWSRIVPLKCKSDSDIMCSSRRTRRSPRMMFHMVMASSISFSPQEQCTLQCYWLAGILITPWKSIYFPLPCLVSLHSICVYVQNDFISICLLDSQHVILPCTGGQLMWAGLALGSELSMSGSLSVCIVSRSV